MFTSHEMGREDNIFWRRIKGDPKGLVEAAGAKSLGEGDVAPLGIDIVHSVTNPLDRCTGALHVYGGKVLRGEALVSAFYGID